MKITSINFMNMTTFGLSYPQEYHDCWHPVFHLTGLYKDVKILFGIHVFYS
jgi:hypothetical protein